MINIDMIHINIFKFKSFLHNEYVVKHKSAKLLMTYAVGKLAR